MKFKPAPTNDDDVCWTEDSLYDLFYGGGINPESILEDPIDIQQVKAAVYTIERFLNLAEKSGHVNLC